jgi:hypothetical protein
VAGTVEGSVSSCETGRGWYGADGAGGSEAGACVGTGATVAGTEQVLHEVHGVAA